jgi:hypothetical protein
MPGYKLPEATEGRGLLPWSWADERLARARNYWVSTTRRDGRPHTMPVWGIWMEGRFWFSTGRLSRKARNLEDNPACVICPEPADEAVILEGTAEEATDSKALARFVELYNVKYSWEIDLTEGPIYAVRPTVAFGFIEHAEDFATTATRWKFDDV